MLRCRRATRFVICCVRMPPKNAQPRVKGNARPASSRYVPPCPFPLLLSLTLLPRVSDVSGPLLTPCFVGVSAHSHAAAWAEREAHGVVTFASVAAAHGAEEDDEGEGGGAGGGAGGGEGRRERGGGAAATNAYAAADAAMAFDDVSRQTNWRDTDRDGGGRRGRERERWKEEERRVRERRERS